MSFQHSTVVPSPIEDVFGWHERPGAIRRLMPPWQPVRVIEEAASLADGRAVLRLPGGLRWVAQHSDCRAPERFVDTLVSLPLRWRHLHAFTAEGAGATRVTDSVDTPVPASLLRQLFWYRHRQLAADLATHAAMTARGGGPLTVGLTGSSGLVGSALGALLTTGGHQVIRLVRRPAARDDERQWDPEHPDPGLLEGIDALVHLAGASIAGRFSDSHKRAILESRVAPTRRLAELVARRGTPRTFVAASAIGFYGANRGDEVLGEDSGRGDGFLAEVVAQWEDATTAAAAAGVRVVHLRTGIVQSPRGGVLRLLRPLFASGLGGPLGDGAQWVSWIDLDDLTDVYLLALVDPGLAGPLNAVAPTPVRFGEYARTLGRVLRRPALLRVPAVATRLVLGGEGAQEVALASQRVSAGRLEERGHRFRHPNLEDSLRHQLGRVRA